MHENPAGHDTHMFPRAPHAFDAVPATHWLFEQHPFAQFVALQVFAGGEHEVDTVADRPSKAPKPKTRMMEMDFMESSL